MDHAPGIPDPVQREVPKDWKGGVFVLGTGGQMISFWCMHISPTTTVLDENAQTLFMTELFRGLSLTLKNFFEPKFTVRGG